MKPQERTKMTRFFRIYALAVMAIFFAACAPKPDILGDTRQQEHIFTAIKNYNELIKINKNRLRQNDTPQNRLALAQNYFDIGDFKGAKYYVSPLIDAENPDAVLLYARVMEAEGRLKAANFFVKKAIALDPKNAQAHNLFGVILTQTRDFDAARRSFFRAKELFLADKIVDNNLAMLEIVMKNYDDAIKILQPLYARGEAGEKIIANLVLALAKNHKDEQAMQIILRENLAADPKKMIALLKTAPVFANKTTYPLKISPKNVAPDPKNVKNLQK